MAYGKKTIAVLVAALGIATAIVQAKAEVVVKAVMQADLKVIDPIGTGGILRNHGYMVYDTLFALDEQLEPKPQMVEDYTVSDDKLTYTFRLRENLRWHDGTDVTSEDCVASLNRWGKRDVMGQKLMTFVDQMEPVDARSFKIVLKEPYGFLLPSLAKIGAIVPFMMPKRLADSDPFKPLTEVMGSGPFKFVMEEWQPGAKAVYVRNPDYVSREEPSSSMAGGKKVYVDRVEWHYIPDYNTAINALLSGEIDYIQAPPHSLLPLLENDTSVRVEKLSDLGGQLWMRMNFLNPPLNNIKVRQAIMAAVQQELYLQAVVGDPKYYTTCVALFMCNSTYASDAGGELLASTDLELAKRLLKESGYNNEPVVILQPTDLTVSSGTSVVTAQILRNIGMNVQLQPMDWSTLAARRAKTDPVDQGGWSIFHTDWNATDVYTPLTNVGVQGGCAPDGWPGWPCDSELERLRDAFVRATDLAEQKQIAEEIQKRALDLVTIIPLGQMISPVAVRANITDLVHSPVPVFWNLRK